VQRKVFRVEQMFGGRVAGKPAYAVDAKAQSVHAELADASVQQLKAELALLHDAIARNKAELSALLGDRHDRRMTRAAGDLGAAVEGMEKATVKILKSTEVIDESARALTASLKDDYKRGLAQEIQDQVVEIYETCNFQDIGGQRIGNVIAILNMIEERVACMLKRYQIERVEAPASMSSTKSALKPAAASGLINGPRLDGASGHTSQNDIDALFG
jgi:chemotaxis protein CheZ